MKERAQKQQRKYWWNPNLILQKKYKSKLLNYLQTDQRKTIKDINVSIMNKRENE